jgi:hypothetical protein
MDDLATSYLSLMEDPRPFSFFNVKHPLGEVPWPLEASLEQVPSRFRPSNRLNRYGVLYLALLGCLPFRGLQENKIRDVRKPPASGIHQHTCTHRDQLLIDLADILLLYERGCELEQNWKALHLSMRMGLSQIQPFIIILQNLKQRDQRPKDRKLRGKANRYQRYYNELFDAIPRLTLEDYDHGREPLPGSLLANIRNRKETLLTLMYNTFTERLAEQVAEGVPNTYSQQSIFESITSILNTFEIYNERNRQYTTGSIKRFLR